MGPGDGVTAGCGGWGGWGAGKGAPSVGQGGIYGIVGTYTVGRGSPSGREGLP
ncbi:hypothetical protein TPA0598_01_06580 [Streptomyces lydicamycinicus]|uniref:Uncharacterized protein n=1 Tax=Streptomyces lydicamycinicus TaxID=1546107 RepID=A0A0P4R0L7_9ACTN|nr:hypothetical protein TPA0598_01_06580 [Streptomyces lydicamycinicus]